MNSFNSLKITQLSLTTGQTNSLRRNSLNPKDSEEDIEALTNDYLIIGEDPAVTDLFLISILGLKTTL